MREKGERERELPFYVKGEWGKREASDQNGIGLFGNTENFSSSELE